MRSVQRGDNYPHAVSDPEAEGLPGYADDDSVADERRESGRIADGPDPAALPSDTPLAVDRYGTTAEEARLGEPLDYKLAQEQPEHHRTGPNTDEGDALTDDVDNLRDASIAPIQPNPDSPVSMYDVPGELDADRGAPVGRLMENGDDLAAFDAGAAGGGPTAEEAAIHEVRER
ncbi:hypothetical protein [Virgisporangium aurantiacum]|nr:hypothetical protein [Virgisporangium aurantiacum]